MALVQHLLQRTASQQLAKEEKKSAYERLPSLNNDFSFGSTRIPPVFLLHNHKDGTETFLSGGVSAQSVL